MKKLFSLGKLHVSDFVKDNENPRSEPAELQLVLDENGAARLDHVVDKNDMYGKYWYRSGTNDTMKRNLKDVVESIASVKKLKKNDVWLDIACNDGTLLSLVPGFMKRVGIDPADDSYFVESSKNGEIVQDFFSAKAYKSTSCGNRKCDVVTTIAMFYDLDDPRQFIRDVHEILNDDGLWVLQLSYTPLMIEQLAFDNICHEHVYYYSLFNLKKLFEDNGFQVMDSQLNDVNGGSIRVFLMKSSADVSKFGTRPHRDVCNFRMQSLLAREKQLKLNQVETWQSFYEKINDLKLQTIEFIQNARSQNKRVWAYGASTKGNTLLQYFGLDNRSIEAIAERNPQKFGLKTVGTNIPIKSESEMREANPDYLLVLPWHFISEFITREEEYLRKGGKFIVPCPKFEIISWENV